ncbi:MAG: hypothetical protein M1118_01355 [Chloroflexi bacterium]|nr:hypothetical protein [Chloroflexota bacterium]
MPDRKVWQATSCAALGGLWLVAGLWKFRAFADVRLYVASFRGVPLHHIDAITRLIGITELVLGAAVATGRRPKLTGMISMLLVGAFSIVKLAWPHRGGDPIRICSCLPTWPKARSLPPLGQVLTSYAGNVALLCLSVLVHRLTLSRDNAAL